MINGTIITKLPFLIINLTSNIETISLIANATLSSLFQNGTYYEGSSLSLINQALIVLSCPSTCEFTILNVDEISKTTSLLQNPSTTDCYSQDWAVGTYSCGEFTARPGVILILAAIFLFFVITVTLTFTHCLKTRLVLGQRRLVCRKSTWKGTCLHRRARKLEVLHLRESSQQPLEIKRARPPI